jgi:hypothetical protein
VIQAIIQHGKSPARTTIEEAKASGERGLFSQDKTWSGGYSSDSSMNWVEIKEDFEIVRYYFRA